MRLSRKNKRIILLLFITLLFITGCSPKETDMDIITKSNIESINEVMKKDEEAIGVEVDTNIDIEQSDTEVLKQEEDINKENKVEGNIEVHYIDVGQGDSILIKQGKNNMLIDAGDNHYGQTVVDYLKANGIEALDYVIGTHPHSDHIGGLDDVISSFNIGKVIMPKVTHTTQTFEDVILSIQAKGLKITTPVVGDIYELGDAKFTILGPNQDSYSNLNNYSVISRLEFGDNSFLFTGDSESQAETEVINNGLNIKSDVLSAGHHGSDTSTTPSFLNKVQPSVTIISVGAGNKYSHPDNTVIKRLEDDNIKIYRSDLHGTIIAKGDGTKITFETKKTTKSDSTSAPVVSKTEDETKEKAENTKPEDTTQYIGNRNSKIFHKPGCSSLPADKNRIIFNSKEEATSAGHRACQRCNP